MFDKYFKKHYDTFYVVFRVLIGLLFFVRGGQKIFGLFGSKGAATFGTLIWTAGIIELVGGLLIAIGLFSRLVAFIAALEMIGAYAIGHLSRGLFPFQNGGEAALLYLAAFLVIVVHGSKKFSVEKALCKNKECF